MNARTPTSTYRLQISASFDLSAAAGLVDYVRLLGADWLYLSPLLTAEPGSNHGYDVVDHGQVDEARGGAAGLDELARAARAAGLGVLVDIVPNHVGVASPVVNRWWWDVLQHGESSRYAEAFDIDWEFGAGRLRIPVLGDEATPELVVVDGELRYHEHRFPLRPDTPAGLDGAAVHDRQHYELVNWRRADADLNYRRFFAVNSLAAIRVEVPWVFDESHREIGRWVDDGLVDGLRVDHPDGLFDPGAYLDALAHRVDGRYVLVEKILEGPEQLPPSWRTDGTTGYEALAEIDRVLIDPAGEEALGRLDTRLRGAPVEWAELVHDGKRWAADTILRSEVRRVEREIRRHDPRGDGLPDDLADAIAEVATALPVYRTYLPVGAEHLHAAVAEAVRRRPDLADTVARLAHVLADPSHPAARRFQQTSGMIMAKGVEDRAFYQYSRLTSLTEVGGEPSEFSIDVDEFHRRQQRRLAVHPATMTTLSTHDTKRGEDVRARLDVLSEIPERWTEALDGWRARHPLPDPSFEQLIWQAIVGAWPLTRERLGAYAEKAAREAGLSTSWSDPDAEFESAVGDLVAGCFDDPTSRELIESFVASIERPGWSNSLAAKLVQLTSAGVPDVYQGSELWEMSLVDPDNRRPVDYAGRSATLDRVLAGDQPPLDASGAAKLLVTARALRLRRDRPELFTRYVPIPVHGPAAHHVIAFDRGGAITIATRLPVGLEAGGGWRDTSLVLPAGEHLDVITQRETAGGPIRLDDLLATYPVALLARSGDAAR
ncbi:MAG: malto-oligosyltrehalose synthase [Ilumatobacteraceae bacterium]